MGRRRSRPIYRIREKGQRRSYKHRRLLPGSYFFSVRRTLCLQCQVSSVVRVQKNGTSTLFADSVGLRKFKQPNYSVFDSQGNLYMSDSGEWSTSSGCVVRLDSRGKEQYFSIRPSRSQTDWHSATMNVFYSLPRATLMTF